MTIATLLDLLPADRVITDPSRLVSYAHDDAEWAPSAPPLAVVRPRSTDEVATLVRWCRDHAVPVVPRGAGTGLSGGANATAGSVVVSFEAMTAIREIDQRERLAVVEPGVVNDDLRAEAARHGLWYPPDPASSPWSTIGGNVATNAGGVCCVKYGVTGDYVLGLEVVTGTGEVVRLGRRTAKGVAGLDLCSLMVGSEGTLGIITEITLRLRPSRPAERTIAGQFEDVSAAGRAVAAIGASGVIPSALELVDRHCLEAVDRWKNMGLAVDAGALLLARVDSAGATGDHESATILAAMEGAGATFAALSTDDDEAEALFAARRLAYPALERLGPVLTEDVCVPMGAVPEMLDRIVATGERHGVLIANIAHAGDGNLHPLLIVPADDPAATSAAQAAFEDIIGDALDLGGTVTGEHGVGLLKRPGLTREVSPLVAAMQHAVKRALDPHDILNPGKALPDVPAERSAAPTPAPNPAPNPALNDDSLEDPR